MGKMEGERREWCDGVSYKYMEALRTLWKNSGGERRGN